MKNTITSANKNYKATLDKQGFQYNIRGEGQRIASIGSSEFGFENTMWIKATAMQELFDLLNKCKSELRADNKL